MDPTISECITELKRRRNAIDACISALEALDPTRKLSPIYEKKGRRNEGSIKPWKLRSKQTMDLK